ncbi:MAG: DUF2442 domain-containing protein [Notoacmeibacter sp.]
MTSSAFDSDKNKPTKARCDGSHVIVTLVDGRTVTTPLWWYPFLQGLNSQQLNAIELMEDGIWWEAADEGISVKSMLLGLKMPNAQPPQIAAE